MASIKQVKLGTDLYDLDNRCITVSASAGTLTEEEMAILRASSQNYVLYHTGTNSLELRLTTVSDDGNTLSYARVSPTIGSAPTIYKFTVTVSTRAFTLTSGAIPDSDTKNTAGSTDISSKIFLVGATSQAANPQTYSDNQVYATNGQLDANKVRIAEAVTMVYDSTNKCINFNFA